jgi:hypothetical protein
MKKGLLLAVIAIVGSLAVYSGAASRQSPLVTKTSVDTGDTRAGFLISVSSKAWVNILPASGTRRYAIIYATSTSITEVCLSTVSAAATVCSATLPGRHLPSIGLVIEDNSGAALYARGIGGGDAIAPTAISLYGETQYDSGD